MLEKISKGSLPEDRLKNLALWLTERSADREPVKFGIAILGLFSGTEHHELFKVLGRHEEFTLYAPVALANTEPRDAERSLFELAKHVDGWGRIQIVQR